VYNSFYVLSCAYRVFCHTRFSHEFPITTDAEYYISKLLKEGKSPGEIVEFIFDKLDICDYPERIRKVIKKIKFNS